MKKTFFLLVLVYCLSGYSLKAQDTLQISPAQLAQTILDKIDHEVALTEQQKSEVMALLLERSENIRKIKGQNSGLKPTMDFLVQVNETSYKKLRKVLTEEQYIKLQELRRETKEQQAKYPAEEIYRSDQDVELDF